MRTLFLTTFILLAVNAMAQEKSVEVQSSKVESTEGGVAMSLTLAPELSQMNENEALIFNLMTMSAEESEFNF